MNAKDLFKAKADQLTIAGSIITDPPEYPHLQNCEYLYKGTMAVVLFNRPSVKGLRSIIVGTHFGNVIVCERTNGFQLYYPACQAFRNIHNWPSIDEPVSDETMEFILGTAPNPFVHTDRTDSVKFGQFNIGQMIDYLLFTRDPAVIRDGVLLISKSSEYKRYVPNCSKSHDTLIAYCLNEINGYSDEPVFIKFTESEYEDELIAFVSKNIGKCHKLMFTDSFDEEYLTITDYIVTHSRCNTSRLGMGWNSDAKMFQSPT